MEKASPFHFPYFLAWYVIETYTEVDFDFEDDW